MSRRDPVTVARFAMEHEARVAAEELAAQGIQTFLTGTEFGAMYGSYVGTAAGGIELQVARDDVPKARGVLSETSNADATDWQCPQCRTAVEGEFAACWNCGAEDGAPASATRQDDDASPRCQDAQDQVSGNAGQTHRDAHLEEKRDTFPQNSIDENDELANRALKAGVFSLVFPPMLLLAAYLILNVSTRELSSKGTSRFYAALLMFAIAISPWLIMISYSLRPPLDIDSESFFIEETVTF